MTKKNKNSRLFQAFFPIKKPIIYISILGIMLGLRIALGYFSINIGPTVLSFTWVSLFIAGFIVGPFIGFIFGWITDSVGFLMHPGIYMWEYSIQESIVCLFVGMTGVVYRYFKENKKSVLYTFIIFEIIFTAMIVTGLVIMIRYFNYSHVAKNGGDQKWINSPGVKIFGLVLISAFYLFLNWLVLIMMIKHKGDPRLIMLVSLAIIGSWILFSWIEGPWAYVRYYERKYGISPKSFKTYGYKFYSISRILKSLFSVPFEITITIPVVKAFLVFSKRSEYYH